MKEISLIIGETASLPKEITEKFGMVFIPYIIEWKDGETLSGENIFQKMREAEKKGIKTFPKTSQPSPWIFKRFFDEGLKRSETVLCITLSSKLSGGFNSALQAREMLDKKEKERIFIIDSLNVTVGEGLVDLRVAELIQEGKKIGEVLEELKKIIERTHLFGMLGDPKWTEAGGRLSHSLAVLLKQMQKIGMRPLIGLKEGELKPVALKMQAKDVPTALFKELEKETERLRRDGKKIRVAIGHADNQKEAEKLRELIERNLKRIEIAFLNLIDPVIGIHTGPDTLVCTWFEF